MKLEQLTFTRFFAAISIVIYHYGENIFPFNLDEINFIFRQANVGVSYFFILSGFVMIIAYGHKDKINFIQYMQKRLARLYPVYFLAILILLLFFIAQPNGKIDYKGLFLNLALVQSWLPGNALSFNYPGWSLSTELFFYLSFPFLYNLLYKKFSFQKIIIPVLICFVFSQILFHYLINSSFYKGFPSTSHDFLHYFPLMHINEFLIGNITGLIFLNSKFKKENYDLLIVSLIIFTSLLLKFNFGFIYHNGMLAILFVPLIILISINNGVLSRISKIKYFVFLGEISYGIYILQVPIFTWGNAIMKTKHLNINITNPELVFGINFFVLILFSGISYKYIEKPLRDKINNWKFKEKYVKPI